MKLPDEFTSKLRRGFFKKMKVKSIGPKKISVTWNQMNMENIEALLVPVMKTGYGF